jgi:glucose-6-phosphate 1-dehydrogenase
MSACCSMCCAASSPCSCASDELEAAWEWVEPILDFWEQEGDEPMPYTSGTWGPPAASALIGRDGLQWREEALPEE